MTLEEAIKARHSVRAYKAQPLAEDIVKVLEKEIEEQNRQGHLHIQLVKNEPKALLGRTQLLKDTWNLCARRR